jgi:hypothetical protein
MKTKTIVILGAFILSLTTVITIYATDDTGTGSVPNSPLQETIMNLNCPDVAHPRTRAPLPNATGLERGCVQSTSRSKLEGSAASGILRQAGFAKPLRLVYDTAALRGQCQDAPTLMDS